MNSHQEALSEIQKAKSRTCWIDFDIDASNPEVIDELVLEIKGYINSDAVVWLKTRGGVHCLVDPEKVEQKYKSTFYRNIAKCADQTGDNMIPVPGCCQGGFTPHFINF